MAARPSRPPPFGARTGPRMAPAAPDRDRRTRPLCNRGRLHGVSAPIRRVPTPRRARHPPKPDGYPFPRRCRRPRARPGSACRPRPRVAP
ncbi:hypothetical protein LP52_20035 [Streptomonospora alba]|uniref:Uncharacterized protein n=1 Tax=Streptomonospora alba TaxID=183763 RepID=A0A0C2JK27_9ACTN|nr:hypothetical protein LP52_20035 [Streptomonospora alba]